MAVLPPPIGIQQLRNRSNSKDAVRRGRRKFGRALYRPPRRSRKRKARWDTSSGRSGGAAGNARARPPPASPTPQEPPPPPPRRDKSTKQSTPPAPNLARQTAL